jgi:superfamily II DNA or RNA helicase
MTVPVDHPLIQEMKKELTVRPLSQPGFPQPASFKVFRVGTKSVAIPRFYGQEKIGNVKDGRPDPVKVSIQFTGKLRDQTCQNEALAKAIDAQSGVLSLPCGYGKTTVALALAAKLGYRTMIIVHKEFLANQWRERIQQFCPGATIGLVQQGVIDTDKDFVIAMLQSLTLKEYSFDAFESIGTLIVDEAHHICAKVFSQALFKICPKHIYGLSATPERKDGLTKILHWFMGPLFFSVQRENQKQVEVFQIQYDCKEYNEPPPVNKLGKLSLVHMTTQLVEDQQRTQFIIKLIKQCEPTRKILVLSDRRLHCEELCGYFPSEDAGLYMGGMKKEKLDESSEKRIIFGTFSQAHEGLDIPALDTVFLVTPKSEIQQAIGRILRETDGKKNTPQIWDICDPWSILYAMSKKRLKVYKKSEFTIHGQEDDNTPQVPKGFHFV